MSGTHVIIGIHGLAPKPTAEVLEGYWRSAIVEGLERNEHIQGVAPSFRMVYWGDWDGKPPIPEAENPEPYLPAPGDGPLLRYEASLLDDIRDLGGDLFDDALEKAKEWFGFNRVADDVLEAKLRDLHTYYHNPELRDELRGRLRQALLENAGKRILLIAHSMGSIVAYDVLRALGEQDVGARVAHFVTIGAPLGLPHVLNRIREEGRMIRTPSAVGRWTNQADKRDPVALDSHIAGDFRPNASGVQVADDLVSNGYLGRTGKANHHKSYGYLRTPEMSALIRAFL